jgi:cytochrome c554/c'-like protein
MKTKLERLRHRLRCASLGLGLIIMMLGLFPSETGSNGMLLAAPQRASSGAALDAPHQYTGPGACSSTTCHGSIAPMTINRVKQNEYSVWIVRDKHSKAYAALTGKLGERMGAILGIGKSEAAPKCLACHALDVPVAERARTFDMTEGVSCENCHGPAAAWLGPHTERDWKHEDSVGKLGMYDTRDIIKRTERCLTCHLGSEEKYVDHEMIAAGHPDLYFELDSFSAQMPRHWKDNNSEPGQPDGTDPWYDVREWATGQAVQLKQALVHLAERTHGKVWPEYAELECYACHHSIVPAEQSWEQARGYANRRPGDPPWNASRYVVFREIVHQVDETDAQRFDSELSRLNKLMSELNPNREEVAAGATNSARLAGEIAQKLNSMQYNPALTLRLLQRISSDSENISVQGEHCAAQAAMALQSLYIAYDRNEKFQDSQQLGAAIGGLFEQLQVPSSYDPNRFSRQMKQVRALLR